MLPLLLRLRLREINKSFVKSNHVFSYFDGILYIYIRENTILVHVYVNVVIYSIDYVLVLSYLERWIFFFGFWRNLVAIGNVSA